MAVAEDGTILKVSAPVGVPDRLNPRVYALPLIEILVGVAAPKVATPPEIDNVKSVASNAPLPPLVSNTASEKVTVAVELSLAIVVEAIIVGAVVSKVIPVTETSVAALPPASVPLNAIV